METFEEAVWVVVFPRSQLQKLTQARSMTQLTATVFVWYAGEPALYSNRSKCNPHMLSVSSGARGIAAWVVPYQRSMAKLVEIFQCSHCMMHVVSFVASCGSFTILRHALQCMLFCSWFHRCVVESCVCYYKYALALQV